MTKTDVLQVIKLASFFLKLDKSCLQAQGIEWVPSEDKFEKLKSAQIP